MLPLFSKMRARAQRAQCTSNLHSLYLAAQLYVQDKGNWPQIAFPGDNDSAEQTYATAWIDALQPYGVPPKTWICPTIENLMDNPDYLAAGNARIDYQPMPFDAKPTTPNEWPHQPWFVETADVHGHGNLLIYTDGTITDLKSLTR